MSFHILRHSLATHLAAAGWPPKAIQQWLRHRDVKSTMRYIHTPDGELARLWRRKSPLKGPRGERVDMGKAARELVAGLRGVVG